MQTRSVSYGFVLPHAFDRTSDILRDIELLSDGELVHLYGKTIQMTLDQTMAFYYIHRNMPFFRDLCKRSSAGPSYHFLIGSSQNNAIIRLREVVGPMDMSKGEANTIRRVYGESIENCAVEVSDSPQSLVREAAFVFSGLEIIGAGLGKEYLQHLDNVHYK